MLPKYHTISKKNILAIQQILELDDKEYLKLISLTQDEFDQFKSDEFTIPIDKASHFTEKLDIPLKSLVDPKIDLGRIKNKYYKKDCSLPARYNYAKFSRSRTLINILSYVDGLSGRELTNELLREYGVSRNYLVQPENSININLMTDLCESLNKLGYQEENFVQLGAMSYETNRNGPLGMMLSQFRNIPELFDYLLGEFGHSFDHNCRYILHSLNDSYAIARYLPTEEAIEAYKTTTFGSEDVCFTKMGVMSSLPNYIGRSSSKVEKRKSIYQGDPYTEYLVTFQ